MEFSFWCVDGIPRISAGSIFSHSQIFRKVSKSGSLPPSTRVNVAGLMPICRDLRIPRPPLRSLSSAPRRRRVMRTSRFTSEY